MRLSSMRYKSYVWPHNPETFTMEYRRQVAAHKIPMGGCVLQEMGVTYRVLQGEGEFARGRVCWCIRSGGRSGRTSCRCP